MNYNQFSVNEMIKRMDISKSIYYTLTNAKIDIDCLNEARITVNMNKVYKKETKLNLIIDDTAQMKQAKGLLFGTNYIGNVGKVDNGCNMVTVSFGVKKILEPVDAKFYISADKFALGKEDPAFKTKIELAKELIEYARDIAQKHNKEIGYTLSDCFYGSADNINDLNKEKYKYFMGAKSNRNLKGVKLNGVDIKKLSSFVTAVKALISAPYKKDYFKVYQAPIPIEIKDIDHEVSLFIIQTSAEKERLYISNDLLLTPQDALDLHLERSYIDVKEYKETKTDLHLLDCRFHIPEGYYRHVKFVFLCFDILRGLAIKLFKSPIFSCKALIHQLCAT